MKRAAMLLVMMVMASCAPHSLEGISLAPSRRAATAGEGGMMTRHPRRSPPGAQVPITVQAEHGDGLAARHGTSPWLKDLLEERAEK